MDVCQDTLTKCPQGKDAEVKKAKRVEYAEGRMKGYFDLLNTRVTGSGGLALPLPLAPPGRYIGLLFSESRKAIVPGRGARCRFAAVPINPFNRFPRTFHLCRVTQ